MCWKRSLFITLLALLLGALPAFAQSGIIINGDFSDWAGKASLVDPGGADEGTSPSHADTTEFRADAG